MAGGQFTDSVISNTLDDETQIGFWVDVVIRFPSVVAPAIDLSDDAAARSAKKETVSVGGKAYFTGGTAVFQGAVNSVTGLSQGWIDSPEHAALFLSGLERLKEEGVPGVDESVLVLGLPSDYFKTQRETLRNAVSPLFSGEILIQPQSAGPLSVIGPKDPLGDRHIGARS